MREVVICLVILALVSPCGIAQDENEWRATGRIVDCFLERESAQPLAIIEFRSGRNQPILCLVMGDMAIEIVNYWNIHKDCECRCRIGLVGRLRNTVNRVYIRVVAWGPKGS